MKQALKRNKILRYRIALPVLISVISICCLFLVGCGQSDAAVKVARPDIVTIDGLGVFDHPERSPVLFPHDRHTDVLIKQGKECDACHLTRENGYLSQKFMRLVDSDKQEVMEIYHEYCITCHNETADAGLVSGPITCGECHRHEPVYISSRQPFGMDKSLHYRHIKASDDKCDLCHHEYDENNKELVYVKGNESSCRDCHRKLTEENRLSFKLAAHSSCVGCHRKTAMANISNATGPQRCEGCHDKNMQLAIEKIENPPRLNRNQPDFVLLAAPESELSQSKLNTVPFSHVSHEGFSTTCRSCHHETLKQCSECHSLAGKDESGGITLQQAMHDVNSNHSCIGCHETEKSTETCAGCHALMEQGRLSEHSCTICHAGPFPGELATVKSQYNSLDNFKPKASEVSLSFSEQDIPDQVTISVISEKYEPAVMPHRKIISVLMEHVEESKIATHFHGDEDVVCQGCHHHSPVGKKPPLCESCHGEPFNEADLFKPGLYGAYHRQCLGCHQYMEIEKPSDCVGCHAEKRAGK